MVVNGDDLLMASPIKNMLPNKQREHGVSHGLAEVGYDIRLKQAVRFVPRIYTYEGRYISTTFNWDCGDEYGQGNFCLASAIEEFDVPGDLVGIVHDKSTWARKGLSVFNTVIEPGWRGFLTLELVYHGQQELTIPAGAGIAQVIFHQLTSHKTYEGKYQDQAEGPIKAKFE